MTINSSDGQTDRGNSNILELFFRKCWNKNKAMLTFIKFITKSKFSIEGNLKSLFSSGIASFFIFAKKPTPLLF